MKKSCSTAFLSALHPAGTASDGFCRQVHMGKTARRAGFYMWRTRFERIFCGVEPYSFLKVRIKIL